MALITYAAAVHANCVTWGLPLPQCLSRAVAMPGKAGEHFCFPSAQHKVYEQWACS